MARVFGFLKGVLLIGTLAACAPGATSVPTQTPPPTHPTEAVTSTSAPPTATALPTPSATTAATPDLSWLLESGPASLEYRIPLLTRHVSETSAWLQYELPGIGEAALMVWPVDRSVPPQRLELHEESSLVQINGLQPATRYAASIVVGGADQDTRRPTLDGQIWPPVEYRTQPSEPGFQVGVIGDSGFGDPVTNALVEQMARRDLAFTLHTGDLVYRVHENPDPPSAYIEKLYAPMGPLLRQGPFYPVPGNHEYDVPARWDGEPYYKHAFPQFSASGMHAGEGLWYAFEYGDVQFVMLDSQVLFGVPGQEAQEDWLEARLQDESYRYSVLVLHVPPYSVSRHRTDAQVVNSRWSEYFTAPGVALVLSGHDHNYQRFLVDGKPFLVSGGGSAVTYPLSGADPRLRTSSARSHFAVVTFEADRLVVEAVDERGISVDWTEMAISESLP